MIFRQTTSYFIGFVYLLSLNSAFAQLLTFQHITTNDGLSQNSVVSIAQDSFGFIYYATQDGLNKYDGTNFTIYEEFFSDITRENYSELGKIYIDSKNRIWIVTLDGKLKKYDKEKDSFVAVEGLNKVSCIVESDSHTLYVGSHAFGLTKIKLEADTIHSELVIPNLRINQIVIQNQKIILATRQGVLSYDGHTVTDMWPQIKNKNVSKILINNNEIIIGTHGDGVYYSNDFISLQKMPNLPSRLNVQDLLIDHQNHLWIATYGQGAFLKTDKGVKQFMTIPGNNLSLNYNDILVLFEDKQKNIWFGTDGGGASFIQANAKPIYQISKKQLPSGFPVDVARAISTDSQGNIWVGTSGNGLTVVNKSLDELNHFSTTSPEPYQLVSDRIVSLFHDDNDNFWIGSQGDGLMEFKDGRMEKLRALPCETIWDIEEADESNIWLASRSQGLFKMNKYNQKWKQFNTSNSSILSNNIRVIIKGNSSSEFYIGTEDGHVMLISDESGQFLQLPISVQGGPIKSMRIIEDKLWVGTHQKGILIYDFKTNDVDVVDKSKGLKNNMIYAIMQQDKNSVWVSSNAGISQLSINKILTNSTDVVNQHFTQMNGLISNEFNTGAHHIDEGGVMYFGGIDGVNYFNPNYILKDAKTLDVIILDLITTDQDGQHVIRLFDQEKIELDHTQHNFQIRYVAQDFSKKSNINYKYKLEGIHDEWISNEQNELVNFSNLPVGQYSFLVKASNRDGIWNPVPNEIQINIVPAFWQRTWFKLLIASIIIGSFILFYKYRIDQIKRTSLLKQRALKAESRALKSQMNPHFIFNSLNSIDSFIINNEPEMASDYLTKFSKLIRNILEYSHHETISLDDEFESLKVYLKMEQLRFKNKFNYTIEIDDEIDSHKTFIPTMVIQPFVENAIWHGLVQKNENGSIKINASRQDTRLQIDIIDDGIGRKRANDIKSKSATKRKSYGMRITKERMKLLKEIDGRGGSIEVVDLSDENSNPMGTKVSILFQAHSYN